VGRVVMTDPERIQERDGKVVVVTPCACRSEIVLSRAEVRLPRWQTCPNCEQRWRLYVLGSGRVLWTDTSADSRLIRPRRKVRGVRRWRR
jgi:hypothetical protein